MKILNYIAAGFSAVIAVILTMVIAYAIILRTSDVYPAPAGEMALAAAPAVSDDLPGDTCEEETEVPAEAQEAQEVPEEHLEASAHATVTFPSDREENPLISAGASIVRSDDSDDCDDWDEYGWDDEYDWFDEYTDEF